MISSSQILPPPAIKKVIATHAAFLWHKHVISPTCVRNWTIMMATPAFVFIGSVFLHTSILVLIFSGYVLAMISSMQPVVRSAGSFSCSNLY